MVHILILFPTFSLLSFVKVASNILSKFGIANRLQLVLNSAARAVTKTPKFHHITPILKSLHWLLK